MTLTAAYATVRGFSVSGGIAADGVVEEMTVDGVADPVEAQQFLEEEGFGRGRPAFIMAAKLVGMLGYAPPAALEFVYRELDLEIGHALQEYVRNYEPEGDW